jgi:hypothetical protein
MAIWYMLWSYGIHIFPVLVCGTKENLSALVLTAHKQEKAHGERLWLIGRVMENNRKIKRSRVRSPAPGKLEKKHKSAIAAVGTISGFEPMTSLRGVNGNRPAQFY